MGASLQCINYKYNYMDNVLEISLLLGHTDNYMLESGIETSISSDFEWQSYVSKPTIMAKSVAKQLQLHEPILHSHRIAKLSPN